MGERIDVLMVAAGAATASRAAGRAFGDSLRRSAAQDRKTRALARVDAAAQVEARSRVATSALFDALDL